MASRREIYLEEMGLAPVWRLRQPGTPTEAAPTDAAPLVSEPAAAVPAVAARARATPEDGHAARVAAMHWPELKASVAACAACGLCRSRTNTVFGVGDENADWLLVGEAPGAEEDARGEPFVGQAGRLLDNMLAAVGLQRGHNVYIANVLKCRPPGNRNPEPFEVSQCSPYLARQVALIAPKLLVAMGRFAAQTLLGTDASIASLRGRLHRYHGVPCVVTYHPAYLLRNLPDKAKAWEDLCFARATMRELERRAAAPT
jgi:DNA polymerase